MTDYLVELEKPQVVYANFWLRLIALILDGIIMMSVVGIITFVNLWNWRSVLILLISTFTPIVYKILMEYKYGATIGKLVLKIKVVNVDLARADLKDIILRNIFGIAFAIASFGVSLPLYLSTGAMGGFSSFGHSASLQSTTLGNYVLTCTIYGLYIIEAIMVATDDSKRSLHDRIARTFVVLR
ncbi:MAG: hypothetical protein C5B52_11635 [Bacteroidetes bacterium]|nr:MAG: hypothetical protein C5B52_11635 [Bacteroidota bacterium]